MARTDAAQNAAKTRLAEAIAQATDLGSIACRFWDGGRVEIGPNEPVCTVTFHSPEALSRLIGAVPERAFGRAYAEGLIDIEPLEPFLASFAVAPRAQLVKALPKLFAGVISLGGRPDLHHAPAEAVLKGRRHSLDRDRQAVRHHYDLPESFYRLFLDSSLTYSCAYFATSEDDIDTAERQKLDLVCRKLRLQPGERVLDVGCGWGSFAIHAAKNYGVSVTGITLSRPQVETATRRAREEGVENLVEFRVQDYREINDEPYDAIATIGMVEHVGKAKMKEFAHSLHRMLKPGGRLLLHGITTAPGHKWRRGSFVEAFVFPDGELTDVMFRDATMQEAGLELRDVESLREHYALTLDHWVKRLEANWDEAVSIVGIERARIWRLYLTGAKVGFEYNTTSIFQSLLVKADSQGRSLLPLRRADWYTEPAPRMTAPVTEPAGSAPPPLPVP